MISKTTYIKKLPTKTQNDIFHYIMRAHNIRGERLDEAMSGRLCDIEDVYPIHILLKERRNYG